MDQKTCSQIEFLQNEHHKMLQGLYDEIDRLQKKCSDQQFQLVMHNVYPSDEGKLKDKIGELEIAMREKMQECEDLRESLSANKKVVNHLEQELRNLEERYREDVSARNLIVAKLRREVDDKSATIAYLISLHHRNTTQSTAHDQRDSNFSLEEGGGARVPVPPPKRLPDASTGRRSAMWFRRSCSGNKSPPSNMDHQQPSRRTSMPGVQVSSAEFHLPPINMTVPRQCHQDVVQRQPLLVSQRRSVSQGGRTQQQTQTSRHFKP